VDIYRTEDEQIAAIKVWWKENGSAVIWGLVLSLVIIAGWRTYTSQTKEASEAAFAAFLTVTEAFEGAKGKSADSIEDKTLQSEVEKIVTNHGGHIYSQLAMMMLAKHHVGLERWDAGADVLKQALDREPVESVRILLKSRLARIYLQQENYSEVLSILSSETNLNDFAALYDEIKGDAYYFQGNLDQAREAYQRALEAGDSDNELLKIKLDDLAIAEAS